MNLVEFIAYVCRSILSGHFSRNQKKPWCVFFVYGLIIIFRLTFIMFEMSLGTGKTLSIICSTLQWVVEQKQKQKYEPNTESKTNDGQCGSDEEPDWMRNFVVNKNYEVEEKKVKKKNNGFGFKKHDKRNNQESYKDLLSNRMEKDDLYVKNEFENLNENDALELNDEEFLLEEYESEEEGTFGGGKSKRKANGVNISSSSDEEDEEDKGGLDDNEEEESLKVYFCSRTHSQLSQFVKELRKTSFADEIKVVCLGSRKNFCINEGMKLVSFAVFLPLPCWVSFYLFD